VSARPNVHIVGGGGSESGALRDVPIDKLVPAPNYVVAEKRSTGLTKGGLIIPEAIDKPVHVVVTVGENVKHVQVGDIVLIRQAKDVTAPSVGEVKGEPRVIRGDDIIAVLRGL
jgi:hypothetical protein